MAQTAMTIRVDSNLKYEFDSLCEQFGMSASTAVNVFINAVVRAREIPFSIKVDSREKKRQKAFNAWAEIRQQAENGDMPEMTLDEINEEIAAARRERKERMAK